MSCESEEEVPNYTPEEMVKGVVAIGMITNMLRQRQIWIPDVVVKGNIGSGSDGRV